MRGPVEAHFRVSGLLKLQSKPGVFVCGEILDGEVKRGMEIAWPIHGDALTTSVPIREVEFIDHAPGIAGVALGVRFDEDEAEAEQFLRDFLEVGMIISIAAASDRSPSAAG